MTPEIIALKAVYRSAERVFRRFAVDGTHDGNLIAGAFEEFMGRIDDEIKAAEERLG